MRKALKVNFSLIQFPEVRMEKQIKWIWTAIILLFIAVAFLGYGHYQKACMTGRMMEKYPMGQNMKDGMMGQGMHHHMKDGMGGKMKDACCKDKMDSADKTHTSPAPESSY